MNRITLLRGILRFRRLPVVIVQLGLVALSFVAAFNLRFDSAPPDWAWGALIETLPWLVAIRGLTFIPFRLFEGLWKYTSLYDLQLLVAGILTSALIFVAYVLSPLGPDAFPRSVIVIDGLLALVVLGGIRMTRRVVAEFNGSRPGGAVRILVFGAGDAGQMIVREMRQNSELGYEPIGFVDDDPSKAGRRIHGVRVLGGRKDLAAILDQLEPAEILLALPSRSSEIVREIYRLLEPHKIPIKTLPPLRDVINRQIGVEQIRTLRVEDLLARAPVGLDTKVLKQLVQGRCVLVTGAGGSIGSELCRQISQLKPAKLVMLDRYENTLHSVRLELEDSVRAPSAQQIFQAVIADVTDAAVVKAILESVRPDLVFHAAAHKHVPLMEENPCEAVKNNVGGTRVLAAAAEAAGVDRFIMISTDKAANPTSVMGASKRVAELVVKSQASGSGTSFAVVRFGNVLGSNGSVVPRFIDQIQRGGPVTVTHPDVRRFFMLIPEAVQLVLHAAAEAKSGATYVLDMGEQVKVVDMARNLIRLSGRIPDEDIKIVFTGLRPGEKMEEELTGHGEEISPSFVPKVSIVRGHPDLPENFATQLDALQAAAVAQNNQETLVQLRRLSGAVTIVAQSAADQAPIARTEIATAHMPDSQKCPRCGHMAHRSRARRFDQHLRKRLTSRRLYRCEDCGWRGWLVPVADGVVAGIGSLPMPDLKALDTLPTVKDAGQRFSPRNLR